MMHRTIHTIPKIHISKIFKWNWTTTFMRELRRIQCKWIENVGGAQLLTTCWTWFDGGFRNFSTTMAQAAAAPATALFLLIEVSTLPCSDCHSRSNANSFDWHLSFQVYGISIGQSMFAYLHGGTVHLQHNDSTTRMHKLMYCNKPQSWEEKNSLSNEVCFRYKFGPFWISQTAIFVHKIHIPHTIPRRPQARPTRTIHVKQVFHLRHKRVQWTTSQTRFFSS